MRKATAIYHAPPGDNEVTYMCGVRFIDGETVDLNSDEHPHLMMKLPNNQHFEFVLGEEVPDDKPKRGPGRPRKEKVGPTIAEWVEAGYLASNYPPEGFSTPEEIAAAIEKQKASA